MAVYIGFDPGLKGGISAVNEFGDILHTQSMPVTKGEKGSSIDFHAVATLVREWEPDFSVIEKVSAMPGQGVTSMFTFGMGFGGLQAVLCTLDSPFALVRPQVWQSAVFKGLDKKLGKARSIIYCQQRWPDQGKLKDGPADALCVAVYARSLKNSGIIDSRY
jgi:crossover junction endodeoxyribonuclease RuvC